MAKYYLMHIIRILLHLLGILQMPII